MALTPHPVLRARLLYELAELGGTAARADVLRALDDRHGAEWTNEDLEPPPSRPGDQKWRNRVSWERARLIEEGLLEARADGIWSLTRAGWQSARTSSPQSWRHSEITRRTRMWQQLAADELATSVTTSSREIRAAGLYAGARGIYADKDVTSSAWSPSGAAVSLLHLGGAYPDDLSPTGVIYHFPRTNRPGRDTADIAALNAAFEGCLPVFVITQSTSSTHNRTVYCSYIEEVDHSDAIALLTFTSLGSLPPPPPETAEFQIEGTDEKVVWQRRRARPNQQRFAFSVIRRYGRACAVCDLDVPDAVEAAHLRPKARRGTDDERNGLPLCRNHHVMFDHFLWAIEPETSRVLIAGERSRYDLGIVRPDLRHLSSLPHDKAITDSYERWIRATR